MTLPKISFNVDLSQLIYSILVIALIPAALALNTWFLLHNTQRDMDYELNNKAMLVESVIGIETRDKIASSSALQANLQELTTNLPQIKALEVFKIDQNNLSPLVSTSSLTKQVADPTLNNLAWGSDQTYSKQIYATLGNAGRERMWLVVAPIHDQNGLKLGILNIYISAAEIDQLSDRTFRDSVMVLIATMIIISLLLINHFRFFEISIMFKKLSELDKLKDDFISMASHELRAPLTAISGYASVLLQNSTVQTTQEVKYDVNIINEATNRLKGLVDDILDVSRIEQNRMKIVMGPVDITQIIISVYNQFLPLAHAKGLRFIYLKPSTGINVVCDKEKTFQVLTNLVSNAIKYTPQGEISIYHQVAKGELKTFVKDSGVGISEENRSKLFNKFSRIYNVQTKSVSGTGLGLWITKQLVEKMKGKITVESIQGQGTAFIVSFPLTR